MSDTDQKFNRDILFNKSDDPTQDDDEILKKAYPNLADWLKWDELLVEFGKAEEAAKTAKGEARRNGLCAVWFSFFAVLIVVLTPLGQVVLKSTTANTVLSADGVYLISCTLRYGWLVCMLIAVFFASQSLFGRRRTRWMNARARGERLRQLFFQHLAVWFQHLASTETADRNKALKAREGELRSLLMRYDPNEGGVSSKIRQDDALAGWRMIEKPDAPPGGALDETVAQELFKYIDRRRLEFQINHAKRMTEDEEKENSESLELYQKRHGYQIIALTAVFLTFQALTGLLYISVDLLGPTPAGSQVEAQINLLRLTSLITQTVALVAAAFLVARRSIESGLHLSGDIARYNTYAGLVARLRSELSPNLLTKQKGRADLEDRLMRMEQLAYWELKDFIVLHSKSAFSIT